MSRGLGDVYKRQVYRYNHSEEYVDLVIEIMRAYLDGEFSSVPNGVAGASVISPDYGDAVVMPTTTGRGRPWSPGGEGRGSSGSGGSGGTSSGGSGGGGTESPTSPTEAPEAPAPGGGASDPVEETTKKVTDTVKDTTKETTSALDRAKETCQETFSAEEIQALGGLTACAEAVLADGLGAVEDQVAGLLGDLSGALPGDGPLGS